jgi:hypothetical protein
LSLSQLRQLRRGGHRPDGVIVLVGKPPAWLQDEPGFVVIDKHPRDMDFRPLVGLPIHLIDLQADNALLLAAMNATAEAGAVVRGACSAAGSCGVSSEHELSMIRYRECLCSTE